jgi:molybdenum cofactor cytidylyltransferase
MIPLISTIILAAGESKRMGKPKQLLPLGKTTILERTIDNFLKSEVRDVIVIVGYRAAEIITLIASRPVTIVVNPAYREGMSTSIVAGLSMISDKAQGLMLALGDKPFVDSQTINHVVESFGAYDKGIIIPTYQGRRGHPVIFSMKYKDELLSLKGDIGGREIICRHPDDILEVATNCEGICVDIDTMDTYNLGKSKPG